MRSNLKESDQLNNICVFPEYREVNMREVFRETTKLPHRIARIDENVSRKRPRESPSRPAPRHLASLVVADAFAGALTRAESESAN